VEPFPIQQKTISEKTYDLLTRITSRPIPSHHGQEQRIRTKATITEGLQLALVAEVMANGRPEPPVAKHWPADTAEQTMEYRLASGMEHPAHHGLTEFGVLFLVNPLPITTL